MNSILFLVVDSVIFEIFFFQCVYFKGNYGALLLLGVGSLMAGATTGVPMSPAHG
jgi:hypothetical protein